MAFFNTKYPYMRLIDDTSRHNKGTDTVQTSGNLASVQLTGTTILAQDYVYHSYQIVPISATTAEFNVQGSNDNENWTNIPGASGSLSSATESIIVQGEWYSAYSRAVLTGSAGNCLINEIHKV
tara:strand:- start:2902 stop:3273 length:372 start_codon:yes stop_codon:yes gene_type:complete